MAADHPYTLERMPPTPEQVMHEGAPLLHYFGIEGDPTTFERPDQYDQFRLALRQLDPRYKEDRVLVRYELEADPTRWPDDAVEITMDTARTYQMLEDQTPLRGMFAAAVVLGGARQSNLERTRHGATAIASGKAVVGELVGAGIPRRLPEAEQENTANYAPGAENEFDLIAGAVRTVAKERPGLLVSEFYVDDTRAGTPEVLNAVLGALRRSGKLSTGGDVAAITTQIYRRSTQLDLARIARRHGVTRTYVAGSPSAPATVAKRTNGTYHSENLRTLKAAVNAVEEHRLGLPVDYKF